MFNRLRILFVCSVAVGILFSCDGPSLHFNVVQARECLQQIQLDTCSPLWKMFRVMDKLARSDHRLTVDSTRFKEITAACPKFFEHVCLAMGRNQTESWQRSEVGLRMVIAELVERSNDNDSAAARILLLDAALRLEQARLALARCWKRITPLIRLNFDSASSYQ
jgi:hypothetical protein